MVLEKTFESPVDYKEIKPVSTNKNQSWLFIIRTNNEDEAGIFWTHNEKIGVTRDGANFEGWRQKEEVASEDEMDS